MEYVLESELEGSRLEKQSTLEAYQLHAELENLQIFPGQRVLDAGCGTGIVSRYLVDRFPHVDFEACDGSQIRLEEAKSFENAAQKGKVTYFKSSLEALPVADNRYDHIVLRYVFEHLQDPQAVVSEMWRVLKPGGQIYIINFDGVIFNLFPQSERLSSYLRQLTSHLPADVFIGRKIPSLLAQKAFVNIRYDVTAVAFHGAQLHEEAKMNVTRFQFMHGLLSDIFGSAQESDRFIQMYHDEMLQPGSTLFYNKFVIQGIK